MLPNVSRGEIYHYYYHYCLDLLITAGGITWADQFLPIHFSESSYRLFTVSFMTPPYPSTIATMKLSDTA
jgi:hypothetical protein